MLLPFYVRKFGTRDATKGMPPVYSGGAKLATFPVPGVSVGYSVSAPAGAVPISVSRQWYVDAVAVLGATGETFTPLYSHAGMKLSVTESAVNGYLPNASISSIGWIITQYGAAPDQGEVNDNATYAGLVYYIDSVSGDDANNGLSKQAPWKTLVNVAARVTSGSGLPVGSAFLFRRGGTYTGNINLSLNHANVLFGAYGVGDRPKLMYATGMPSDGSAVIGCTGSSSFNRSGVKVHNLDISAAGFSKAGIEFIWVSDIEFKNNTVHDCNQNGITISASDSVGNRRGPVVVTNNTVYNCCTVKASGAGLGGGDTTSMTITYNTVYNCGVVNGTQSHCCYIYNYDSLLFVGNYLYSTVNTGNHGFVTHGLCTNALIARNKISGTNNGFGFTSGYPGTQEGLTNFTIHSNIVENCGQTSGAPQGYGWIINILRDSIIFNNVTSNSRINSMLITAPAAEEQVPTSVSIINNTFWQSALLTSGAIIETAGVTGTLNITNNIFVSAGAGNAQFCIVKPSTTPDNSVVLDNNLYYMPARTIGALFSWNSITYSLAAMRTLNGNETNGKYGDPLFDNQAAGLYSLSSMSPAKNSGISTTVTEDLLGVSRSVNSPTIGAFE